MTDAKAEHVLAKPLWSKVTLMVFITTRADLWTQCLKIPLTPSYEGTTTAQNNTQPSLPFALALEGSNPAAMMVEIILSQTLTLILAGLVVAAVLQ
jgi:hypothetical protein